MGKQAARIGLAVGLGLLVLGCRSYEQRLQELSREPQGGLAGAGSSAERSVASAAAPLGAMPQPVPVAPAAARAPAPPSPVQPMPGATSVPAVPAGTASPGGAEPAEPPAAVARIRQLYQRAVERYAGMDSYIARLRRIEEVGGKVRPQEIALFKFRKEPWSVYFKWLGSEGKGREATFVKGRHEDKLHTKLAAGDVPLMPAGKVLALDPFGPLVRLNSRHPITEAGIGALIDKFGILVRDWPASLSYQGVVQKPELPNPLDEVLQAIPPGLDPNLPKGGTRRWYFDTQSGLPVMIMTWDPNQQLVEQYIYDQIMHPVKLDDDDFNPETLWKKQE